MKIEVLTQTGNKTGRFVELPADIFESQPNDHAIYLAAKQFMAAQRQGTHKVKTRAEVQGASRKLHKQKGTGGSRKGNIRNPLYKGGGTIFGPKPHLYNFKLNRKVKDLAKIGALSYKQNDNAIMVVEDFQFQEAKTKQIISVLQALSIETQKTLIVLHNPNRNVYLSCRNIPNADTALLTDLNTHDILNADVLIFTETAANIFNENEVDQQEAIDEVPVTN